MDSNLKALRARMATIYDLDRAAAVLEWDQQTYMPPGGAAARAEQLATLAEIGHELFTDQRTGELLDAAARETEGLPADSLDRNLVRVTRRDYDRATRLPADLVSEISRHAALAREVWVEAREKNDYPSFAHYLRRTVELSRERAEHLGYEEELYDALLDEYEPGMTTGQVRQIFTGLREALVPLVAAIRESGHVIDDRMLHQPFDEAAQERFGVAVITRFGYDFSRGRQDRTVHPFEISFSRDDVRITTRFDPAFLGDALFSTMHEAGHGLYEQGVEESLERTPLGTGVSLGVHESQSRLWENVVGRRFSFWECFYPQLQQTFPQLSGVPLPSFYRAINQVRPSFVRVDADEVTYNLHIMLRVEMELELLAGRISVRDAPTAWNEKMQSYLGITPPTHTLGILQDVHWSSGMMGYFMTYSLGNILSVQFFDAAIRAHPEIPAEMRDGKFDTLRSWLAQHVYLHGRMFDPGDLIERATGQPLTIEPYLSYLRAKFGEIYDL